MRRNCFEQEVSSFTFSNLRKFLLSRAITFCGALNTTSMRFLSFTTAWQDGNTALIIAASFPRAHVTAVKLLLEAGANMNATNHVSSGKH